MSCSAADYLQDLKCRLETMAHQAALTANGKQRAYAKHFNQRSSIRRFGVGDQVILLIPDSGNKIYACWTGPGKVVQFCFPHSYKVKLPRNNVRQVHVNKIRKYYPKVSAIKVIFEERAFWNVHPTPKIDDEVTFEVTLAHHCFDHLSHTWQTQIKGLLEKHRYLFNKRVHIAKVGEYKIRLSPGQTKKKPYLYRIPKTLKPKVDEQIEKLLRLGLIEDSIAEIAHSMCVCE
ncbi:uncharacterized protein LOC111635121 [Centruroides sculpturatus]|uniref:uncharacterized protein LOC111635121 n=1 Tax=Centruroides sculpturatus TaxID=218467 RepID=UPI000C6D6420|nr:uncharacterized protein LOC111635121 [Centruroides sculpturatus]